MKLDNEVPRDAWEEYNKRIDAIVSNPSEYGLPDAILPVVQFLGYFCPVNPPCNNIANMSSYGIMGELSGMCDVDVNTVSRLMLKLGYKVYYNGTPEWSMMRALFEE